MPESLISDKPLGFAFNAKNREAQRIARDYGAAQIDLIDKETKQAVRTIIQWSIREGIAPRDAAKLIKKSVGLNRPQILALIDYERRLPPEMSPAVRAKATGKYRGTLVRRRALMIARTEVIDALNLGAEVAWKQAQGQGLLGKEAKKEWLTTPVGACNVCLALNGKSVKIGAQFPGGLSGPTAHPNCRCGLAPVP